MNPLTQFKKILILPLLIALALVALASATGRARGRCDRLEPDRVERDRRDCGAAAAGVGAALCDGAGAVYDAVNAIDRGHQPYLVQPPSNPTDSKEAAAATAAFRVLVGIFPGAAANAAAAVRRLHSGPARQPTGIEGCWDRYR